MTGEGVKVFVMSLGCDKNLADTEHMMGIMAADGYSFTQDEEEADPARKQQSADSHAAL